MGTTFEAVDAPEPLSLRSQFTLAAGSRLHVRAELEASFGCETAILHVLEGAAR